jgi:homoserine dehydrogenase
LTAMYSNPGISFDEVLSEAQKLGYAEADPSLDIDGHDTVHKIVLVLALTHGIRVSPKDIFVRGIRSIDPFDIQMAKEFAYKIKLLAIIIRHGADVEARIHPTMIPEHHPLASVDGVFNGIYLQGDMVGEQLFYGKGAGREPTASAVVGDIIETARNVIRGESGNVPPLGYSKQWTPEGRVLDIKDVWTNYYIRIQAKDRPGVLSKVSGIMGEHSISLHSVMQKARHASETVPVIFLTHKAKELDMKQACEKISKLDSVDGNIRIMRIEDESLC